MQEINYKIPNRREINIKMDPKVKKQNVTKVNTICKSIQMARKFNEINNIFKVITGTKDENW